MATQRELLPYLADLVEKRGFNLKAQCFDAKTRDLVVQGMFCSFVYSFATYYLSTIIVKILMNSSFYNRRVPTVFLSVDFVNILPKKGGGQTLMSTKALTKF